MKKMLFLGTTAMILLAAVSCKKKKDTAPPPTPTVTGFWVGKYGSGTGTPTTAYAYLFKGDGTLRVYTGNITDTVRATKADGIYILSGTQVKCTYIYPSNYRFSSMGIINVDAGTITGTWGEGTVSTGNTFFLNKQ